MKTCSRCKEAKPYSAFHKATRGKDGYNSMCKVCKAGIDKQYREDNKEKIAITSKKRFTVNKEHYNENRRKRYHSVTPEEVKARKTKKREYCKNAPEHVKQRKKDYDKKYFASEAGKITTAKSVHKRRAQKIATEDGTITSQALEALKVQQSHKCYHCRESLDFSAKGQVHLDHLTPLSKGGCHSITNVVWSCASCNLKKSDRLL